MFFIVANRLQRYILPPKPPNFFSTFFVIFFAGFMGVADNQQVANPAVNKTFPKTTEAPQNETLLQLSALD